MSSRRHLGWPISLGVTMIVLIVAVTVGWVVLSTRQALLETRFSALYWTLLTVGTVFLVLVLVGVVLYLTITIKAYNLNQRQSNFIDAVTHELKSPIASLKLYLQTLGRRHIDEQQQASFVGFMLEDVERLDQLINHLLDAARVEQATGRNEADDVPLEPLLRQTAELVALRFHLPIDAIALDCEPVLVRAPLADLEMVFRNLLDNAVKYGGDPPRVRVEVRREGTRAVVRVIDNGPGVPPLERAKIFLRFVRLGSELERERKGTGLGLYIVRTLVTRMRGRIAVRDKPQGAGAVFEVQLPSAAPVTTTAERDQRPATEKFQGPERG